MVVTTFVAVAVAWILSYPVPWYAFAATGLIDGLMWLPITQLAVIPFLGPTVRTVFGRLAFLQGQVAADGTVQVMTTDGYEFCPYDEDQGQYYLDGEWQEYDQDEIQWYRVGNRKFGLTYEDDPEVLEEFKDTSPNGEGDVAQLNRTRNGHQLFGWANTSNAVAGIGKIAQAFADVADPKMSEEAEDKVLEDEGGTGMDTKYTVLGAMGSLLIASIVGILIFGVFG